MCEFLIEKAPERALVPETFFAELGDSDLRSLCERNRSRGNTTQQVHSLCAEKMQDKNPIDRLVPFPPLNSFQRDKGKVVLVGAVNPTKATILVPHQFLTQLTLFGELRSREEMRHCADCPKRHKDDVIVRCRWIRQNVKRCCSLGPACSNTGRPRARKCGN